jgi:hypothetical protein
MLANKMLQLANLGKFDARHNNYLMKMLQLVSSGMLVNKILSCYEGHQIHVVSC